MLVVAHIGDAYSNLLFVTEPINALFAWVGPPAFGMRRPTVMAESAAFLDTVAIWVVKDRRVSRFTPRYLMVGFTGTA